MANGRLWTGLTAIVLGGALYTGSCEQYVRTDAYETGSPALISASEFLYSPAGKTTGGAAALGGFVGLAYLVASGRLRENTPRTRRK